MRSDSAEAKLIKLLRSAASGELAAGYAYRGHAKSVRSPEERTRLREIEAEEWHHRRLVLGLLKELGSGTTPLRESIFWIIGHAIAIFCRIGGWYIPMYGAGRLERDNIEEYENAARYAAECGHSAMIDCLLEMAEVEWEHERFFRETIQDHWLSRVFPMWTTPPPKAAIRVPFADEAAATASL